MVYGPNPNNPGATMPVAEPVAQPAPSIPAPSTPVPPVAKPQRSAADILQEASDTYRERNKIYGDNFVRVGNMMQAIFPKGLMITTPQDWNRIHMLLLAQVKLSRYTTNWHADGHKDSIRDAAVYCAMLEYMDEQNAKKTTG